MKLLAWTFGAICFAALPANLASGEDFRVDSKVFAGNDEKPVNESLALFSGGLVYDFLSSPREVTLFDTAAQRIVLMDPARKVRTELSCERLTKFCEELRTRAAEKKDDILRFAAEPKFEEASEPDDWMRFSSPQITYRVHTAKPPGPTVGSAYREFCDWSARLNAMTGPGGVPPFPRLAVNAALARDGLIAEKVEVAIKDGRLVGRPTTMHSEHSITMGLRAGDRRQIEEAREHLVTFKALPIEEYLRPIEQADKDVKRPKPEAKKR